MKMLKCNSKLTAGLRNISVISIKSSMIYKLGSLKHNDLKELQENIETIVISNSNLYNIHNDMNQSLMTLNNHVDILNMIIIKNIRGNSSVPVASVFNQFIHYCVDRTMNPANRLTLEEAIEFLKYNASNVKFEIKEIYNYNTNKTELAYNIEGVSKVSFNLPMVIKPRTWKILYNDKSNAYLGGYLHNNNDIIRLKHDKVTLNNDIIEISDDLIGIINKIQCISYDTSSLVTSYNIHLQEFRKLIKELKLLKDNSNSSKSNMRTYFHFRERIVNPKRVIIKAYNDIINIIKLYNVDRFYLTTTICFRGRIYTSGIISPTADKVLRANLKPYGSNDNDSFINMDATASMLQILSVITCSEELSKITNLITDKAIDTWSHLYKELINRDKDDLSNVLIKYQQSKPKIKYIDIDDIYDTMYLIDRNIVKKTIMRMLYGSNPYQISKDLRSEYNISKLSYKHITLIIASFRFYFPYESKALEIIKTLNKIEINNNSKGLIINNSFIQYSNAYYKVNKPTLDFKDNKGKRRRVELSVVTDKIVDKRKSNTASCPNLFHSLDSFICISTIEKFIDDDLFIYTTHDSFRINSNCTSKLLMAYNTNLFALNDFLTTIIQRSIDNNKMPKKQRNELVAYHKSINMRREAYIGFNKRIMKSQYTLSREYSTSATKTESNQLYRYEIHVPSDKYDTSEYLNVINDELNAIPVDKRYTSYVNIYSNHIYFVGGYSQKVSTKVFKLYNFRDAINEFYAKFEQYGDDIDFIAIMQTIRFSKLDSESLETIKGIEAKVNLHMETVPDSMPKELFRELISIIGSPENDPKVLEGTEIIDDKVETDAGLSKTEQRYEQVVKEINELRRIPSKERSVEQKKRLNSIQTLGRWYVKNRGMTRKFMSTYTDSRNFSKSVKSDIVPIQVILANE